MTNKGNPFKDDPVIVELLKELDNITTRRQFRRWRKSFLQAFEVFLEEEGCIQVRASYRELCKILSRHVVLVKKMHAHIQLGDMSPDGCTVKSRQTLGDFFDQMIRVKQVLIDLLPTTAKMERKTGYTKYHLAAVLIDNGFVAYDRLSLCDEIHFHFKKWCLQDVTSKLFLLEMDHYHTQLDIFSDVLADLGLNHAMEVCVKFLHLDDEETLSWEDDQASIDDDDSLSSGSEERDNMDPLPDLSDITFDDDESLNLPLWKVHNFYVDNAEKAETFRNEMKRKSFAMFSDASAAKGGAKPPSQPRRSRDLSPPPPMSPPKPVRQSSFKANGDGHPQISDIQATGTSTGRAPGPVSRETNSLQKDSSAPQKNGSTKDAKKKKKNGMDTTERMSNRTVETMDLSESGDSSSHSDSSDTLEYERPRTRSASGFRGTHAQGKDVEETSGTRRDGLQRADTCRFQLPPTNYLAMPTSSKLKQIEGEEYEDSDSSVETPTRLKQKQEETPEKSFYSFANYYHGNPSDWRIRKN